MLDYLILKDKIISFKDVGYCEVYNIKQSDLLEEIFKKEGIEYTLKYTNCPLGKLWYFEKVKN